MTGSNYSTACSFQNGTYLPTHAHLVLVKMAAWEQGTEITMCVRKGSRNRDKGTRVIEGKGQHTNPCSDLLMWHPVSLPFHMTL